MNDDWESEVNTYLTGYVTNAYGRPINIFQNWHDEYDDIDKAKIACVEITELEIIYTLFLYKFL